MYNVNCSTVESHSKEVRYSEIPDLAGAVCGPKHLITWRFHRTRMGSYTDRSLRFNSSNTNENTSQLDS